MKCEKCNNEAVFHYQSNINGEKIEYHLCADCAKKEGFGEMLEVYPRSMFENSRRESLGSLMESFYHDPFFSLAGNFFARELFVPVLTSPDVKIAVGETEAEKPTKYVEEYTDNIPEDAGKEIRAKRELHALRHQLRAAVIDEEFEKASELRDTIRELEK